MDKDVLDATPTMIHNIPQPIFEEYIADKLKFRVEIRKNHSFLELEDFGDHVVTTLEDKNDGSRYRVRSKHVVACDGAKSTVRKFLGIESEGENAYEMMMTIHIDADLRPVLQDRPGMLHWVLDPSVSGFIIAYDLSGNQVLICNFDSDRYPVSAWNEDLCRRVVDAAIGDSVPYPILSYRPWVLSRQVARKYRSGNVFLAGDAAHSFPPTGGLGLNSGLGDVHNLAYKLAAVHQGWGSNSLLDTYELERRQVALVNSQQSVKNGKKIFGFLRTLGITDLDVNVARENLWRRINNNDPEIKKLIDEGVEGQREHFDNLGLHIGYVYGQRIMPENASIFLPIVIPGARLPHAWITTSSLTLPPPINSSYVTELRKKEIELRRFSTLDLIPVDVFTLIVGYHYSDTWSKHLENAKGHLASKMKMRIVVHGKDFEVIQDNYNWVDLMKLDEGQATLVRPDQHILAVLDMDVGAEGIVATMREHLVI
ncbi:hypothetical protein Plec18167_003675 [Paecilomyces lecythidis]|uniref:FAD-binding domain-containing protein n=1 Tax=Paecilomyces lecythidis TaxID=3004212 RepID=A0ABR3XXI3_9EURO